MTAQFVNGSLETHISILLLVTSSCMIIGGIFVFFLPPDSTGHSLDQNLLDTGTDSDIVIDDNISQIHTEEFKSINDVNSKLSNSPIFSPKFVYTGIDTTSI